ncbi:hypothetical protein Glove_64g126 [Diversispora epigaea]|uniref:C2H2-type domain-containing protein n=1 Tax=Diversispora epigaea TaxID=1348612 RepID=A0A397JB48_9GLOM|nr:hypothetical protein Glove_64g126 [Diversispora epigaea]
MPKDFKCLYCDRYFSSRQAYAQHVNRTHYDINDTSLDDKDFNRINRFEEMQTGWEESLPSITNENEEYEDQNMPPASHEYEDVLENTDVILHKSQKVKIPQKSKINFGNMYNYDINDTSLDDKDFNRINRFEEMQTGWEESLPSITNENKEYEDQNMSLASHEYEDVLENTDVVSNFSKNYDINQTSQSNFDQSDRFEESNIEDYDNFEQVSPEREENVMEFPNEAYADLMELFIKHNLNNKTGNAIIKFFDKHSNLSTSPLPKNIEAGRKLMDIMNVQKLPYSKHCILNYKNKEYFVYYRPIKSCIENLLSNPDIIKNFIYKYQFLQSDGETLYSEQYSGNWWKNAEASIRPEAHILSIILYSDATTTDSLGKSSLHPIYISLGNIRTWRRNKEDAKQLLGYLPILSANNEGQTSRFKRLARETFHNSLKFLLDPLFNEDGIDFKINNKNIWFFPRISTVIGDWLEACTFLLTFKSANSNYPCHFCQTHRNNLTSIRKDCIIICNKENMQEYYNNGSAESIGLEQVYNYFWTIPNIDIYAATVPDRMHHLDLGLFRYQIKYTKELLGKSLEDKMNRRIAIILRHPGLKIFAKGVQSIARLTASEFRDLMKVMVFVVDNLLNKDLSEVYVRWNRMYLMSRFERFTESDLENFQSVIKLIVNNQ